MHTDRRFTFSSQVCNTGSLATSVRSTRQGLLSMRPFRILADLFDTPGQGYGTALGVIASLHTQGRLLHAYFAQTGPYQQGARLTAVELASLGAPNTMICDTAIGALMAEKRIHLFVAGADRCVLSPLSICNLLPSLPPLKIDKLESVTGSPRTVTPPTRSRRTRSRLTRTTLIRSRRTRPCQSSSLRL